MEELRSLTLPARPKSESLLSRELGVAKSLVAFGVRSSNPFQIHHVRRQVDDPIRVDFFQFS